MALQVWLPLNGSMENQGLLNLTPTQQGTISWIDGKIGQCLSAGQATQTVNGISYDSNLVSELGTEFSAAVWVKPLGNHVHYNGTFVSSGNWNSKKWAFGVNQSNSQVDVFCQGYNNFIPCEVPINTWTHLCCVHQGTTVKLYKNGEYIGEKTGVPEELDSDAINFCVGRETYASGYFSFNGNLNDLRIYDHCLSIKEIKELAKGLILHYKLDGKEETSSNLITTEDGLSNTAYNSANNKYGYNTDSNIAKIVGDFNGQHCTKVYMITEGQAARPYVYINNLFVSDGGSQPPYKAVSFDYYGTIGTYINHYKLGNGTGVATWKNTTTGESGTFTNSGNILVTPNQWNHIEIILHGTTEADAQFGYFPLGNQHISSSDNYWLFANVQVEAKDHVTPYMGPGGSRNYTTEFDCSGYKNNGTPTSNLTLSTDTPKYSASTYFPSGTTFIAAGRSAMVRDAITVNLWIKFSTWGNPISCTEGGGWNFETRDSSGGMRFPIYISGVGYKTAVSNILSTELPNEWHMLTGTCDRESVKIYIDGELKGTTSTDSTNLIGYNGANGIFIGAEAAGTTTNPASTTFIGNISDVRIYATALSEEDISELYHTAASIDNHGNVYTGEIKEV